MKKLLVLVVVLAVASLASAVPVWTLANDAGVITVSISGNEGSLYIGIAAGGGDAVLGTVAKGAQAPADSQLVDTTVNLGIDGIYGVGEVWTMAHLSGTPTYIDGAWLTGAYTGTSGVINVFEYIESTNEFAQRGQIVIPEPATVALLTLGGLLLRRKK